MMVRPAFGCFRRVMLLFLVSGVSLRVDATDRIFNGFLFKLR